MSACTSHLGNDKILHFYAIAIQDLASLVDTRTSADSSFVTSFNQSAASIALLSLQDIAALLSHETRSEQTIRPLLEQLGLTGKIDSIARSCGSAPTDSAPPAHGPPNSRDPIRCIDCGGDRLGPCHATRKRRKPNTEGPASVGMASRRGARFQVAFDANGNRDDSLLPPRDPTGPRPIPTPESELKRTKWADFGLKHAATITPQPTQERQANSMASGNQWRNEFDSLHQFALTADSQMPGHEVADRILYIVQSIGDVHALKELQSGVQAVRAEMDRPHSRHTPPSSILPPASKATAAAVNNILARLAPRSSQSATAIDLVFSVLTARRRSAGQRALWTIRNRIHKSRFCVAYNDALACQISAVTEARARGEVELQRGQTVRSIAVGQLHGVFLELEHAYADRSREDETTVATTADGKKALEINIKNLLKAGRRWQTLVTNFGEAIILLLGKDVTDTDIETRFPEAVFSRLLFSIRTMRNGLADICSLMQPMVPVFDELALRQCHPKMASTARFKLEALTDHEFEMFKSASWDPDALLPRIFTEADMNTNSSDTVWDSNSQSQIPRIEELSDEHQEEYDNGPEGHSHDRGYHHTLDDDDDFTDGSGL